MTANVILKQILLKRGNSTVSSAYVGPLGEITLDTTFKTIRIHDGITPGGNLIAQGAQGPAGPAGDPGGATGPQGNIGSTGATGIHVISANIISANLVLTLSNNSVLDVGSVIGATGPQGNIGLQGNIGATGPSANIAVYDEGNLVIESVASINFVGATITANTSAANVTVTVSGNSDRLASGAANLILTGGANPYTTFPAVSTGEQLFVQGSEVASENGNLALTSRGDLYVISNGEGVGGGSFLWKFNAQGGIVLPNSAVIKDSSTNTIAFGRNAGAANQGNLTVALGDQAGENNQGNQATAVGSGAGNYNQSSGTVAIGSLAGSFNQGLRATAIGSLAGASNQGEYAVAIGNFAGGTDQPNNSIMINASGLALNGTEVGLYINPIREDSANTAKAVYYNTVTKEVTYANPTGGASLGNLAVAGSRIYNTDGNIELTANDGVVSQTWRFDPDGGIRTPNELLTIGGYTILTNNNNELDLSNSSDITIRSNVGGVALGANWGGSQAEWRFEADGNLTLPNGTQIRDGLDNGLTLFGPRYPNGYEYISPGSWNTVSNGVNINVERPVGVGQTKQYDWTFAWDGSLYAPDNADSTFAQGGLIEWRQAYGRIGYDWGANLNIPVGIKLQTTNSAYHVRISSNYNNWIFGTSGNLFLPGNLVFADGTIQSTAYTGGGGGAANTGNITFNNTTIQGVGDEYGSGGIYLSPDPSLTANLMYFRVRGGDNPTHLHFDTGNGSYYDQYFGDDAKYLKLAADGNISVGTNSRTWTFDIDGNLTLPQTAMDVSPAPVISTGIRFTDGTFQTTAFTGSSAKIDIVNTNGLTTTYYPTFVEATTNAQEMRADVDLTYRTDDNLLRSGNIQVGHNIYGSYLGGISNAIQFRPNISIDKRFLFTVDSSGGTYVRSSMEMPSAEVDKAVTLAFPHLNSNAGFIYVQGADTNSTEFNNAFNIMMNSGNVKISALSGGGNRVWNFTTLGQLIYPDTTVQTTAFTTSPTLNVLKINVGVQEKLGLTAGLGAGVDNFDCSLGHITYNTSISANWTINLVNLNLDVTRATTITIVIEQGATGYYPNVLQIAGVAETINWQGNTTPIPSSNRTDVVTFSILRHDIGSGSGYTVLGQLTGF